MTSPDQLRPIDTEVADLLREAETAALTRLRRHRTALDRLTGELVEHESLGGAQVRAVLDTTRTDRHPCRPPSGHHLGGPR